VAVSIIDAIRTQCRWRREQRPRADNVPEHNVGCVIDTPRWLGQGPAELGQLGTVLVKPLLFPAGLGKDQPSFGTLTNDGGAPVASQ
jgi:hypothetical protein